MKQASMTARPGELDTHLVRLTAPQSTNASDDLNQLQRQLREAEDRVYELLDRLHDSASGRESTTTDEQKQKQLSVERQQRYMHGALVRQSATVAKYHQQQQSADPPGDPKVEASEFQPLRQRQKSSSQPQPFTQRQRRNEV
jgi:hypothetical protein